ncbi:MAG: YicC/YloC family endoribonuclease, partial [Candidatus Rokuibacteriota bacterium]
MIRSMTGYGRAEATGARTILSVECKSVNHRHLDVSLKLPRVLGGFESDARRLIQSAVQRGRVDISAAVTAAEGTVLNPLSVNLAQATEYAEAARTLA